VFCFSVPVLDQADNSRRLVNADDDSDVSSLATPVQLCSAEFLGRVRSYRLSFPLHGLMVSRYRGESASPLHQGGRNFTCTETKLSKTNAVLVHVPNP
jgi:hypothetical protein